MYEKRHTFLFFDKVMEELGWDLDDIENLRLDHLLRNTGHAEYRPYRPGNTNMLFKIKDETVIGMYQNNGSYKQWVMSLPREKKQSFGLNYTDQSTNIFGRDIVHAPNSEIKDVFNNNNQESADNKEYEKKSFGIRKKTLFWTVVTAIITIVTTLLFVFHVI